MHPALSPVSGCFGADRVTPAGRSPMGHYPPSRPSRAPRRGRRKPTTAKEATMTPALPAGQHRLSDHRGDCHAESPAA